MGEAGGEGDSDCSSNGMPKRKARPLPGDPAPAAGTPRTSLATCKWGSRHHDAPDQAEVDCNKALSDVRATSCRSSESAISVPY